MEPDAKVAYLKGLIDGCNLAQDDRNKEKFLAGLIDALETITRDLQSLHAEQEETNNLLDSLMDDVFDLKYGDDSDDCDCDDCHCGSCDDKCGDCEGCTNDCTDCPDQETCGGCDGCDKLKDEDEDDNAEEFDQMTCPHCGEKFYFDATSHEDGDKLICPYCGKTSTYNA